ncbi:MAG: biotin/lipoyl-binding protein, partial [Gammaproteobacteria bacterium]|nr:biotin/lipoyl-binding protein [Gammaproteobacteria bacterium]
ALDAYYIRGVSHNISFLSALIAHPRFVEGRLSTNFIADEYPDGFHPSDVPHDDPGLPVAIAASIHRAFAERAARLSGQLPSHEKTVGSDFVVIIGTDRYPVQAVTVDGGYEVTLNGQAFKVISDWQLGQPLIHAEVNGRPVCFQLDRTNTRYRLSHRGTRVDALVVAPGAAQFFSHMLEREPPDLSKFLLSPMPGLLVRLAVSEGDEVKAGEELAVVEAMKMENSLRADDDVVVAKVLAQEGESLIVDQPIVEFS